MNDTSQLLTLVDAGKRLGVSRWTLRRWIDRGMVRSVHIGGRERVSAEEVERVGREGGLFHS